MLLIWSCRWWLLQKKCAIKFFREKCLVMGLLYLVSVPVQQIRSKWAQFSRPGGVLFLSFGGCNMQKLQKLSPGGQLLHSRRFSAAPPIYPWGPFFHIRPCKSERCWTVITYMKRQADKPSQIRQLNVTQWWWAIHNVFWWSGKHLTSSPQKRPGISGRLNIHD